MQGALKLHPEWNGDWQVPANLRKAEIDIRNGTLIRELDTAETPVGQPTPTPSPTPKSTPEDPDADPWRTEDVPAPKEVFVTDVPAEFRRIEFFVGGTIPARAMIPVDGDGNPLEEPDAAPKPDASATPLTETWQETQGDSPSETNRSSGRKTRPGEIRALVSVVICPVTDMRATANCPRREAKSFRSGTEPKEFCPFHVN